MSDIGNLRLSSAQAERLLFIERLVNVQGHINREDIVERFRISSAASTNDIRKYAQIAPDNLIYNVRKKRYEISNSFEFRFPVHFLSERAPVYTLPDPSSIELDNKLEILSSISVAIQNNSLLQIKVKPPSSDESFELEVIPVAIANCWREWYLRAFDRMQNEFTFFSVREIVGISRLDDQNIEDHELPEEDMKWNQFVTLELERNSDTAKTKNSSESEVGNLEVRIRLALVKVFFELWKIEGLDEKYPKANQFQYSLKNSEEISGFL